MDYRLMSEIDLKLHLLKGSPIEIDNLTISPYTISEIMDVGHANYMQALQILSFTVDDFIKSTADLERRIDYEANRMSLKPFDFYTMHENEEMLDMILQVLSLIFKTGDVRLLKKGIIGLNFYESGLMKETDDGHVFLDEEKIKNADDELIKTISRDNFDDIVKIVKMQNFLSGSVKSEYNPANEEARKLAEQMERNRKKVEAKKKAQQFNEKGEDDETDIADIISAVTGKSHSIDKFNVWDLTLYQLYDEYSRLEVIDSYEFSIKAMIAGAKEVDLRHWSGRY